MNEAETKLDVMVDGWLPLASGGRLELRDGQPVRLTDGGALQRAFVAAARADSRAALIERVEAISEQLLAEASAVMRMPLRFASGFDFRVAPEAQALVEVMPGRHG